MSSSVASDTVRFAIPATFQIHRNVLPRAGVEKIRAFVTKVLGARPELNEGQQDQNWAVDFRTIMANGDLVNPSELVGVLKKSAIPTLCREIF